MDAFKKFFKLPTHIEPMALIVLGYGAETPEPDPDRFKKEKSISKLGNVNVGKWGVGIIPAPYFFIGQKILNA